MGQIRFTAPQRDRVPEGAVERAYLAGMEYIPWLTRCFWDADQIVALREIDDSGNFYICWDVEGHGEVVLTTTSLMERTEPYNLPVELARGTLNRIRNQLAMWEATGFHVIDELRESVKKTTSHFIRAATSQDDSAEAASAAEEAIVSGLDTINLLAGEYVRQVLKLRHDKTPKLTTLLGANIEKSPLEDEQAGEVLACFNAAVVPICWGDVESEEGEFNWDAVDAQIAWCREAGLKVCSGPLLSLAKTHLPDWLYLWEDDFDTIHSYAIRFVGEVVKRYRGRVQIWQCASGMNVGGAIQLTEQDRLRLTVDSIEAVRVSDSKAPVVITFDQPWAEYLAKHEADFSPIHFADALVRAELGVAGIGLEINAGYFPGGTLPREMLDINKQIDLWSVLGLPLLIMLTIPSSDKVPPQTRDAKQPVTTAAPVGLSGESQLALAERLIPLLVAKQSVYAVFWNQLRDSEPHDFVSGGLFDAAQKSKPVVQMLADFRADHLE